MHRLRTVVIDGKKYKCKWHKVREWNSTSLILPYHIIRTLHFRVCCVYIADNNFIFHLLRQFHRHMTRTSIEIYLSMPHKHTHAQWSNANGIPPKMKTYIHMFFHGNNHINKNVNLENNFILAERQLWYRHQHNPLASYPLFIVIPLNSTYLHCFYSFTIRCTYLCITGCMCFISLVCISVFCFSTCKMFHHRYVHPTGGVIYSNFVNCIQLCTQVGTFSALHISMHTYTHTHSSWRFHRT